MKKWIITAFLLVLLGGSLVVPLSAKADAVVSPALSVLAAQNPIAKAELVGEEICFSADDFKKALNASDLSAITVSELPDKADGILYLGGAEVVEGQLISAANLPFMKFVFTNENVTDSSFCFSTNLGEYDVRCNLYSLKYQNAAPVISSRQTVATAVSTYKNVTLYNRMEAYDPDGDVMTFEIVEYPQNGTLTVTDRTRGVYCYVPESGYVGKDSFRYVVADKYGNYSAASQIELSVSASGTMPTYEDMKDNTAHVAAIAMAEKGIMSATELDGKYYFQPRAEVSRAEFLTMVMKCVGIEPPASNAQTVFADDADIPEAYRDYVDAAQKLGYVCGKLEADGTLIFAPNDAITRAEAATVLHNVMSLDIPVFKPFFVDDHTVPTWAEEAISTVTAAGIMEIENGYAAGDVAITRDQCAEILYRLSALQ